MAARSSASATSIQRDLQITRIFDAPRELVFRAWSEPAQMAHWWGPKGFTLPVCEMDFRPGGAYRLCMRSPEGNDFWVHGVYREIVAPERIVWSGTLDDQPSNETVMTVTFTEHEGKTQLTMHQTFDFESEATRGAEKGWNESLDRLAEALAAN